MGKIIPAGLLMFSQVNLYSTREKLEFSSRYVKNKHFGMDIYYGKYFTNTVPRAFKV